MSQETSHANRTSFAPTVVLLLLIGLGVGLAVARWTGPRVDHRALAADLGDPDRRTIAYQKLLDDGSRSVPALLETLGQPATPARADVVELLGRIRDPRALPAVLALDDPDLAHVRIDALGRLRGEEALEAVLDALRGSDLALKFPALHALIGWQEVEAARLLPHVEPFLAHELAGLREFAARFMGARRHEPAVPALIRALRDDDAGVRQAAAWALAQLGTQEAVAAVDSALRSGAVSPEGM
ncbi:MAG: HEAT repeat domain-containing protein [Planctomycetes bacterium]|nr:HEAT repeat domain-containing protein [Planctomycetota bacterium]